LTRSATKRYRGGRRVGSVRIGTCKRHPHAFDPKPTLDLGALLAALPGLTVGEYFISCGCSRAHDDFFLARHVDAYRLSVIGQWRSSGLCALAQPPLLHSAAIKQVVEQA